MYSIAFNRLSSTKLRSAGDLTGINQIHSSVLIGNIASFAAKFVR